MSENNFYNQFRELADDSGLTEEVKYLYAYANSKDLADLSFSIVNLFPDFMGFVEKAEKINNAVYNLDYKRQQAIISKKLFNIVDKIKPKKFSNWQEARDFDVFLHKIDGDVLAGMNKKDKETFNNLRAQTRIAWQSKGIEVGVEERNKIIKTLKFERYQAQQFRKNLNNVLSKHHNEALGLLNTLKDGQSNLQLSLTENQLALQKRLTSLDIKIDQQTLVLLSSHKTLSYQLDAALGYLEMQEKRYQVKQQAKALDAKYDAINAGFGVLSALGDFTDNKQLKMLSVIGSQGLQVQRALTQLSSLSGVAALGPYAVIAMSLLSIASLFKKKQVTANEIIIRNLQQISKQINELHKAMEARFKDVYYHLKNIENLIVCGFQEIKYAVAMPITRRLDQVQSDILEMSRALDIGFESLLIKSLEKNIDYVDNLTKKIISIQQLNPIKRLIELNGWVTRISRHTQFTGMKLFSYRRGSIELAVSPRRVSQTLWQLKNIDHDSLINVILMLSRTHGWVDAEYTRLPHATILTAALNAYLQLRLTIKDKMIYDPKSTQLKDIKRYLTHNKKTMDMLQTSNGLLESWVGKVVGLLKQLQQQYNAVKSYTNKSFRENTNFGKVGANLFANLAEIANNHIQNTIPESYQFNYVNGRDTNHRKGRQRHFCSAHGFTEDDCLKLIASNAERHNIPLFHRVLLLAQKMGLVEFKCHMHRTMTNRGKQVFETDGKKYGLEIQLYVKETQQTFNLTWVHVGHAWWPSADKNTTATTIGAHKRELPGRTHLNEKEINRAIVVVSGLLQKALEKNRKTFYYELSDKLLADDSLVYQTMMHIQLLQELLTFSHYKVEGLNCDHLLKQLSKLL